MGANVLFGLDGDIDMYIMMINDENRCMLMNMFVWKQRRKKTTVFIEGFYKILPTRQNILEHMIACNVIVCN